MKKNVRGIPRRSVQNKAGSLSFFLLENIARCICPITLTSPPRSRPDQALTNNTNFLSMTLHPARWKGGTKHFHYRTYLIPLWA